MLKLSNINTFYNNIQVLKNINIEIFQGEIVSLIGANGAGKTTTLMTISGIVPPSSGYITFFDKNIENLSPDKIVKMGIIQVPEGRHIFEYLTVQENLDMGAFTRNDDHDIKKDMQYIYELFPVLHQRKNQAGGTLSGGEQQMLAISRALMAKPRLLLLDEPSLGLAPILVKKLFDIIKKINKDNNTTIFLVEQNAFLALKLSNRAYVMENGKIVTCDLSSALLQNKDVKKAYLGI